MPRDPEQLAHQQWLGYVQPVGLGVSIPALLAAQAQVNRNIAAEHQQFLACLCRGKRDELIPEIHDFPGFTQKVLGWESADLVDLGSDPEAMKSLEVTLPAYNETLRPTWAVKEFEPKEGQKPWMMLVQAYPIGTDLDKTYAHDERHWQASPQARMERLLRETEVPAGLLFNGTHLRLVYAPRGETSGHATFSVKNMAEVAGRPMFAALYMLLEAPRLFSLPAKQRLPAILADSRKYQNVVSTQLAEQVLAALFELVRGFQAADDYRKGQLLADVLRDDPDHVYAGLLTVLMRLVFLLYAEDRDLLSSDPVYANFYAVTGLFERLRADAGRYTDTMDQRYGAWAQLLTLFRMIYEGGRHGGLRIPPRKGYLFDPDRYNFLEGRAWNMPRRLDEKPEIPHVSDGVVYRVLQNLLILDGERLSYRSLDVEQIGSVYETMMGFNLRVAEGRSIAVKPTKAHGAPAAINLEALLAAKPADRAKWLVEQTDQKLTGQAADALKKAGTLEDLLAALEKKIASHATPNVVPKGAMVLQPSDERRRSGSHYTPRSLTEPIVRTTLRPVLERLRESSPRPMGAGQGDRKLLPSPAGRGAGGEGCPTPDQILELNVCDPTMGSGAFLVETCRQLGDELVKAWHVYNQVPKLPPDEDEILYARRLIGQRCLYGVDRNPMAVDLAKLSLWLATLAKDHPFTFLDHSLRAGDSLVGLSKKQITAFHWEPKKQRDFFRKQIEETMKRVTGFRQKILAARDDVPYEHLRQQLDKADDDLSLARLAGDLVIAAYFSAENDKQRERNLNALTAELAEYLGPPMKIEHRAPLAAAVNKLRSGDRPVTPFHWEIEFPEVFGQESQGFDAIVGNPPFLGSSRISEVSGSPVYQHWLKELVAPSKGQIDLSVFFFQRVFFHLRSGGSFGLLATSAISFGENRIAGLAQLISMGGTIISATTARPWPGEASVIVSIVHIWKEASAKVRDSAVRNGMPCNFINSRLQARKEFGEPSPLQANAKMAHKGTQAASDGFTLDLPEATALLSDEHNRKVVLPLTGGEEVNAPPSRQLRRFCICFRSMGLEEAVRWPEVLDIVRERVLPQRLKAKDHGPGAHGKKYWWQHVIRADLLYEAIAGLDRCLVTSRVSTYHAIRFEPAARLFNDKVFVFAYDSYSFFAVLQSRIHEVWSLENSSRLGHAVNYSISKTFFTFPFPEGADSTVELNRAGEDYYQARDAFMRHYDEGLTSFYNRFHDPNETSPDILNLRELHAAMDRAVLDAYGWTDLKPTCEFLLDYEEEDENGDEPLPGGRGRKKPWRYRWPDEFRDEVLARLLELNKKRAEEEAVTGVAGEKAVRHTKVAKKNTGRKAKRGNEPRPLPGM